MRHQRGLLAPKTGPAGPRSPLGLEKEACIPGAQRPKEAYRDPAPCTQGAPDATIPREVGAHVTSGSHQHREAMLPKHRESLTSWEMAAPLLTTPYAPRSIAHVYQLKVDPRHSGSCSSRACAGYHMRSPPPAGVRTKWGNRGQDTEPRQGGGPALGSRVGPPHPTPRGSVNNAGPAG